MNNKYDIPIDNNIVDVEIHEVMSENYLPYAVEVARERALPDVRDGLKPVHRRILYGASKIKATPDKPYFKCAKIVGHILGEYHPHGDASVYDAMVILAQDFSTNHTLIDGHGNFGSLDGDSAAAMRYTEARLSNVAMELLRDIEKDTVEMVPNYSDSVFEPSVLPAAYPNLLVNGTFGIAVGLATNIPPHNLSEVIDATCALIDDEDLTVSQLMQYIKGPDLPTGGEFVGKGSLESAYNDGVGKIMLRATTNIEEVEPKKLGIVITEFPYKKNKAKVLSGISEMTGDKKHSKILEVIADIRDESDRNGIRAVIEFKKGTSRDMVEKILQYLFKKSDLQCNINFNMVAIANNKPETLGLKEILRHYINHRKEVILARTKFGLNKSEKRFEIVSGFIKAVDIIEEILQIVRASKTKKEAKLTIESNLGFTSEQSEAIVTLELHRLTSLEVKEFAREYKELKKVIKTLKSIIKDEKLLQEVIKKELLEVKAKYGVKRKTKFVSESKSVEITVQDVLEVEEVVVVRSNDGFIKRVSQKSYERYNLNPEAIEYREGDFPKDVLYTDTQSKICMFSTSGNMYQVDVCDIPEVKWKDKGISLKSILKVKNFENESFVKVIALTEFLKSDELLIMTQMGCVKKISMSSLVTGYKKIILTKLKQEDKIVFLDINVEESKRFLIQTELGFEYAIDLLGLHISERTHIPISFLKLYNWDKIESVKSFDGTGVKENKCFAIDKNILVCSKKSSNKKNSYTLDKNKTLVCMLEDGNVVLLNYQTLRHTGTVDMSKVFTSRLVGVLYIDLEDRDRGLFMFSSKGRVKKIEPNLFNEDILASAYKLRENEKIVAVSYGDFEFDSICIFTDKRLCLKFKANTFESCAKVAGGVSCIKLVEDSVVFGTVISAKDVFVDVLGQKLNVKRIEYKNKGTKGVLVEF